MLSTFLSLVQDRKIFEQKMNSLGYHLSTLIMEDEEGYIFQTPPEHKFNGDRPKNIYDNFEPLYELIQETSIYKSTFSSEQIENICKRLIQLVFDYGIYTAGTGFEAKYKNSSHLSKKLSSFWAQKPRQKMITPVQIKGHNSIIPLTLQYNFRFNKSYIYIQNCLMFNLAQANHYSTINNKLVDIKFDKVDDVYTYSLGVVHEDTPRTIFERSEKITDFNIFLNRLEESFSRFIYDAYYKEKVTSLTGHSVAFEDFDKEQYKTLFEMSEV